MTLTRPIPILGVYEKPFWEWIQKRELRLQRCQNGHYRFPPGPCCPHCSSTVSSWEKVSGEGRLVSWTVFHRQYFPGMPPPYTVVCGALVEGPLLIANLVGPLEVELKLDMRLRIAFEESRTKDGELVIYQWSI
jgi:uncharacterized OB-fold protein